MYEKLLLHPPSPQPPLRVFSPTLVPYIPPPHSLSLSLYRSMILRLPQERGRRRGRPEGAVRTRSLSCRGLEALEERREKGYVSRISLSRESRPAGWAAVVQASAVCVPRRRGLARRSDIPRPLQFSQHALFSLPPSLYLSLPPPFPPSICLFVFPLPLTGSFFRSPTSPRVPVFLSRRCRLRPCA